jgi:hypothetical protein
MLASIAYLPDILLMMYSKTPRYHTWGFMRDATSVNHQYNEQDYYVLYKSEGEDEAKENLN